MLLNRKFYFLIFNFAEGENGFFFGLATAPAHVEDKLDDAWLQFAEQEESGDAEVKQLVDPLMGSAAGKGKGKGKGKKPLKIAMEAMIRGFEKYTEVDGHVEEEEHHPNVTSWHNVPHP